MTITATITVDYDMKTTSATPAQLAAELDHAIRMAIGDGLLTGYGALEVDTYSVKVVPK